MQFVRRNPFFRRWFFNLWYYRNPPWDTGISPPELMDFIASHPPGRALDLGCGTGTNLITLAKNGWQATGVDFAPHAIARARRKVHHAGVKVELHQGDVTQLEGVSGPFDLILDMGCFHSLSDGGRQAYIRNLGWLLAPGGTYLLYVFFRDPGESGPGVTEANLEAIASQLELVQRQNGTERGWRPSAWLTFRKS